MLWRLLASREKAQPRLIAQDKVDSVLVAGRKERPRAVGPAAVKKMEYVVPMPGPTATVYLAQG
jgi:hypothetical protein